MEVSITTSVKIDGLCTCIVLHALGAPRATSQNSVTFRRDAVVDVAMDPRAVERFRLSGQCMERLLAALLKQTNTTNAAGAAPPEDLARRDPDVPSGVRTRSQRARECTNAAAAGDLTRLRRANENGCPWDKWVCAAAAKGGHLECLKYLHENGCPWDEGTCRAAAGGGHLECLKYLHENECPWNERTCEAAASGGHLECLKYAHENGCPWDESTCEAAARCGHLECLQYAHENGCPWDEWVCHEAAKGGHLECLKYAHENRCPTLGDDVLAGIMRNLGHHAAARSYLDSIRGPRCPIESVMATLDEVATLIPDQKYKDMADGLQQLHREKERRRHYQ